MTFGRAVQVPDFKGKITVGDLFCDQRSQSFSYINPIYVFIAAVNIPRKGHYAISTHISALDLSIEESSSSNISELYRVCLKCGVCTSNGQDFPSITIVKLELHHGRCARLHICTDACSYTSARRISHFPSSTIQYNKFYVHTRIHGFPILSQ